MLTAKSRMSSRFLPLFSAAAAYLGLKVGQVFEAAIPIAIIAVGMSTLAKRKNALGRCDIHFACAVYSAEQVPRNDCQFHADVH